MVARTFEVSLRDDLTLPPGRYLMTREDLSTLWGFNSHRQEIIDGGFTFVDTLKNVVPVRSVWISGSLLTSKDYPNDFDVTLIVDFDEIQRRAAMLLNHDSLEKLGSSLGVSVDPYLLPWRPRLTARIETQADHDMLRERGYWDDWWLRRRGRDNGEEEYVVATPRRGYVEVMVDGYAES